MDTYIDIFGNTAYKLYMEEFGLTFHLAPAVGGIPKIHRCDGPAVYGDGIQTWYLNGEIIRSPSEFQTRSGLSNEDMIVMTLTYGHVA